MNIYNQIKSDLFKHSGVPQFAFVYYGFEGNFDHDALDEAISHASADILLGIKKQNQITGGQKLTVDPAVRIDLDTVDRGAVEEYIGTEAYQVITEKGFPPFVVFTFSCYKNTSGLLIAFNHIYTDGISVKLFYQRLIQKYNQLIGPEAEEEGRINVDFPTDDQYIQNAIGQSIIPYITRAPRLCMAMLNGIFYSSWLNHVTPNEPDPGKLDSFYFHSIPINKKHLEAIGIRFNALITSVIAKAFIDIKGPKIHWKTGFTSLLNIRTENQANIYGNFIAGIYNKATHDDTTEELAMRLHKNILWFRKRNILALVYGMMRYMFPKGITEAMYKRFDKKFCKNHFVVSNAGYLHMHEAKSQIPHNMLLVETGGYNTTLPAARGLSFVITYMDDMIYINASASEGFFTREEMHQLSERIQSNLAVLANA